MEITDELIELFRQYRIAFEAFDLESVRNSYHLPCTMQSGEQLVHITDEQSFTQEFSDILTVLKHAKVAKLQASNASFERINEHLLMSVIDWHFVDDASQEFTSFTGVYHLAKTAEGYKIVNIVSHQLSNSIMLAQPLDGQAING